MHCSSLCPTVPVWLLKHDSDWWKQSRAAAPKEMCIEAAAEGRQWWRCWRRHDTLRQTVPNMSRGDCCGDRKGSVANSWQPRSTSNHNIITHSNYVTWPLKVRPWRSTSNHNIITHSNYVTWPLKVRPWRDKNVHVAVVNIKVARRISKGLCLFSFFANQTSSLK